MTRVLQPLNHAPSQCPECTSSREGSSRQQGAGAWRPRALSVDPTAWRVERESSPGGTQQVSTLGGALGPMWLPDSQLHPERTEPAHLARQPSAPRATDQPHTQGSGLGTGIRVSMRPHTLSPRGRLMGPSQAPQGERGPRPPCSPGPCVDLYACSVSSKDKMGSCPVGAAPHGLEVK